jgi:hypothetical protein
MRWVIIVACMGENRNIYKFQVEKLTEKMLVKCAAGRIELKRKLKK